MTSSEPPRSVAIVGGGITGLAAAWALTKSESPPADITLFEKDGRLGGKILTLQLNDGWVEAGPDSFLAREPWVADVCREVGLGDDLMAPDVFGAALWVGGRLRRWPAGSLWGLPSSPRNALGAEALSWTGRARALGDLVVPGPLRGPDISVADFVTRRFGTQVLDRLVDPLLAGTRAGSTSQMSLAAALPEVDALARGHRSVMRAGGSGSAEPPPFLGIKGGMERLPERLRSALTDRVRMHPGTTVDRVRVAENGYAVALRDSTTANADAVVLCVPPPAAGDLLRELNPSSCRLLHEIEYGRSASVALDYPSGSLPVPPGTSGVLVPSSAKRAISGCTWWSTKWPRAVPQSQVVRCFVGRASDDPIPDDDDELVAACARDIKTITGAGTEPIKGVVTRWDQGLPQYRVGHLDLLAEIDKSLAAHPRIGLAGAGYRGSGLPDCIRQAHEAVRKVMAPGARE